jgi:hypothetical protein
MTDRKTSVLACPVSIPHIADSGTSMNTCTSYLLLVQVCKNASLGPGHEYFRGHCLVPLTLFFKVPKVDAAPFRLCRDARYVPKYIYYSSTLLARERERE